jgi:adenine-specific DNA methylase
LVDIPRHGPGLADELRKLGKEIRAAAKKELTEFYPSDSDGSTPIAYLWARTITCDSCGGEVPLIRSLWLSKKAEWKRALRYSVNRPKRGVPEIEFEVFKPKPGFEVSAGTVSRAKASCPCCNVVMLPERVRAQLCGQRGGANVIFDFHGKRTGGARLLAVVTASKAGEGREYRACNAGDYGNVWKAHKRLQDLTRSLRLQGGVSAIPDEPLPLMSGTFNVPLYGMTSWGDLFSVRQLVTMLILLKLVRSHRDSSPASRIAALALSRFSDIFNSLCQWENTKTQVRHLFTRQAIPMLWDFAEANPLGEQAGDYGVTLETMARVIAAFPDGCHPGQVQLRSCEIFGILPRFCADGGW